LKCTVEAESFSSTAAGARCSILSRFAPTIDNISGFAWQTAEQISLTLACQRLNSLSRVIFGKLSGCVSAQVDGHS